MSDVASQDDPVMARLTQVLQKTFNDPALAVRRDSWAHDINGWDSFKLIEIVLECQTMFGVTLGLDEMDEVGSVGEIADRIRVHLATAAMVDTR